MSKCFDIRKITIEDYDEIYVLWNATEQSRRALNPVDDSRLILVLRQYQMDRLWELF